MKSQNSNFKDSSGTLDGRMKKSVGAKLNKQTNWGLHYAQNMKKSLRVDQQQGKYDKRQPYASLAHQGNTPTNVSSLPNVSGNYFRQTNGVEDSHHSGQTNLVKPMYIERN